jgi:hypothetical protein
MRPTLVPSLIVLTALALSGCPAMRGRSSGGGGGGGTTSSMAGCNRDFGTTAAAAKLEAFFRATLEWQEAAMSVQRDLVGACQATGRALEMDEADLASSTGSTDELRQVCGRVESRLRTEIAALQAGANAQIELDATPPHCEVSVDAYAGCMAECEATVDPGSVEITCEGGEIRGTCDAQCTGRCAAHVDAACSGVCEGSCEGTCTARNVDGSCAGTCDGTCHGSCVVDAQASCTGECRGGCSVEYREPYCTGRVVRPTASARCRASCDARIEANARCTPGETHLTISGGLDAEGQARLARVQLAVREGMSRILALRVRVERLRTAGAEIVRAAPGIPSSAAAVGINAVVCATAAAGAVADASASVSVSFEVSVSVSGSMSASAH